MSRTPEAVNQSSAPLSKAALTLLCACFAFSGVAALIYQTAWTRQFAIVFGTSELAVATVLAAYMGGLALGAWLIEKLLPRVTRPVLTYAWLELGVAASAVVLVPLLLWLANFALQAWFGNQTEPPGSDHLSTAMFYLVSAFIALALPTTLMGATLPLLARHAVIEEAQIGRRIGLLYATNTAGAVVGALLAAFVLLPELGLNGTLWMAATLNGLVFLLAVALARRQPYQPAARGYSLDTADGVVPSRVRPYSFGQFPGPAWILPLMLLAGAVAFFQEVLWTRMLSHVVGSSIHAFGIMVASFLGGIALGGALGAGVARTRPRATVAFAVALLFAAVAAAVAYLLLGRLMPQAAGLLGDIRTVGIFQLPMNTLFTALLLLPMTLAIGTTYPLAVRILAADANDAAAASARVYAWNTAGAILGSLAAGFVLIPALKYEGAIQVAVLASALLGVVALWVLIPVNRMAAFATTVVVLVAGYFFKPAAPMELLMTSPLNVGKGRVLYYDVGRSASVLVMMQDGELALRTNGLPEAIMETPGSLQQFSGEYWLSPLAVIARPQIRDMLIVGFGGGVVVEGVPPSVKKIDVIELEPKVIEANRATAALRKYNPQLDSRLNIILNDARGSLRLSNRHYDAIVSQPSHPWTSGASHLYTREFMQLAHEHLAPNGVFVQWMNVNFTDEDLLRSLTATLLSVFPEVRAYRPDPNTLVFLASDSPLDLEQQLAATGAPLNTAPLHYARFGINNVEDLVTALMLDTDGARQLSIGAPLITDDDNRIATSSVFEQHRGMSGESSGRLLAAADPLQQEDSFVYRALRNQLSFDYIARRNSVFGLSDPSLADRLRRMAVILGKGPDAEYARAFYLRTMGQSRRSDEFLRIAIEEYPADESLRLEYLRNRFGALVRDQASPEDVEVAAGLKGVSAAILAAARHAAQNDWKAVADMDDLLAQVPWTHNWQAEAVELRVNWRNRIPNPQFQRRAGDDAIRLIDRLGIMNPTLGLYVLRASSGLTARRPEVVIESIASYARLGKSMVSARVATADALREGVRTLGEMLGAIETMPGADATRVAEVRAQLSALAN